MINVPFELEGQDVMPFKELDPFNNNEIEGFLFRKADMRYGMLYITHVNGKPAEQLIWATPKLHYPFDKDGGYKFARGISKIEVYEKLDGTNVMAYIYHDDEGNLFVTYKTRLRPVIKDGQYGRFETLWKEILDVYPDIPTLCLRSGYNVSYELYGKRNKILIDYPVKLDAKVLFVRNTIGEVFPPTQIRPELAKHQLEMTELITTIDNTNNLEDEYIKIVDFLNERIKVIEQEDTQDLVEGMEGSVWYAIADGVILYKCKPDYVRDIHFAASAGIPKHSIRITCINAFEERDDPDMAYIKRLLLEEFPESEIERKWITIQQILEDVRFQMKLKYEVIEEYGKHPEFDIKTDRGTVMRHFAQLYDNKQCRMVFKLLWDEFGGEKDVGN